MTVSTEVTRVIVDGNGVTTSFAYSFPIPGSSGTDQTNAELILTDSAGTSTTLANNLWSITGVVSVLPIDGTASGTFIYNPGSPITTGNTLTLNRIVPYEQDTSLSAQGAYSPTVVEAALDNLALQTEQANTRLLQSLRVPITDAAISDYPPVAQRAGGFAGFDPVTGDAKVLFGTPGSAIFVGTDSSDTSSITTLLMTGSAVTSITTASGVATATFNSSVDITDGANTVSAATKLTFLNGTVGGSNPNATYTAPASGGGGSPVEAHTASNSASLAFTTGVTSTYDEYDLEINNLVLQTTGSDILLQYSTNSGVTWTTGSDYYSAVSLIHNDASSSVQTTAAGSSMSLLKGQITDNLLPFSASLTMTDPLSTASTKGIFGSVYGNISGAIVGGAWNGTLLVAATAYNAFRIIASSGNIVSGSARLYGRPKS